MEQCELCGAPLAADASFCGKCGNVSHKNSQHATQISDLAALQKEEDPVEDLPTMQLSNALSDADATLIIPSRKSSPLGLDTMATGPLRAINLVPIEGGKAKEEDTATGPLRAINLIPIEDEKVEEEDEEKRRMAMLGLGAPLLGAAALAGGMPAGNIPTALGTPQISPIASVQGTPQIVHPGMASGAMSGPGIAGPGIPSSAPFPSNPITSLPTTPQPQAPSTNQPNKPGSPSGQAGCLAAIIIVVTTLVLLLVSFVSLGLTVWAPTLALNGNSSVSSGGTMALHGSSFLPNSSITLTLDNNTPIFYLQRARPSSLASANALTAASALQALSTSAQGKNTVTAQSNGSFQVAFLVDPSWKPGQHTIHASESPTHRGAALNFTIIQTGTTPTATSTPTPTPGITPTATTAASLSCANPGSLKLGPVSELSSQVATGNIILCTSGSGTINWHASWGATWLHLSQNNGTIQAPAQAQVSVTAVVTDLTAGTYTTTVTFTNLKDNTSRAVNISLTVQAGCVSAIPARLVFSGVANVSNPSGSQPISVTNCGLTSNWSAGLATANNWLSISPGGGTLNTGATQQITVTAANLKAGLRAGTYTDSIIIQIGNRTSQVTIVLTVAAPPTISVSPTSIDVNTSNNCSLSANGGTYICPVTLTNSSGSASLTWSWSASPTGTVQASSKTIPAGGSETVTLNIPGNDCGGSNVTFTFKGPVNSATVTWSCEVIG